MIAAILKIFTVLKGLLDVFNYVREYLEARKKAAQEKRNQEREQAVDQAVNAITDEEAFSAQEDVVSNNPRP